MATGTAQTLRRRASQLPLSFRPGTILRSLWDVEQSACRQRLPRKSLTLPPDLQSSRQVRERSVNDLQRIEAGLTVESLFAWDPLFDRVAAGIQHGRVSDHNAQLASEVRAESDLVNFTQQDHTVPGDLERTRSNTRMERTCGEREARFGVDANQRGLWIVGCGAAVGSYDSRLELHIFIAEITGETRWHFVAGGRNPPKPNCRKERNKSDFDSRFGLPRPKLEDRLSKSAINSNRENRKRQDRIDVFRHSQLLTPSVFGLGY